MTAPIGTVANQFTGLREFSQVTNSYGGYIQSVGSAYNLYLPFTPHRFDWFRQTAYGTAGILGQGTWFRDMPAGYGLVLRSIADNGTTGNTSQLLDTTNSVTVANTTGGFYNEHLVISGITPATPGVVTTTTNHNLSNNDRVVLTKIVGTIGAQLNNYTFVVQVLSATTFSLYDTFGVPITTVGTYTSGGQVTKVSPALGDPSVPVNPAYPQAGIINQPPQSILTLGTSIMGANNDLIYFTAWHFNAYFNLGVA